MRRGRWGRGQWEGEMGRGTKGSGRRKRRLDVTDGYDGVSGWIQAKEAICSLIAASTWNAWVE